MKKYDLLKLLSAIALVFTLSACDSKQEDKQEQQTTSKTIDKKVEVKKTVEKKEPIAKVEEKIKEIKKEDVAKKENNKVVLDTCKGCHGANFEVVALGKSKIVANMTKDEVSVALIGYKNGTYGGAMKGIMKGQVVKYSDEALKNTGIGK